MSYRALSSLPRSGDRIDRYHLVTEIAHGGMAVVYAVRRTGPGGFDKLLAMKLVLPHLLVERRFVDMFLDEAMLAARISHPNVLQVFECGEHDGAPFMIMELLRGKSLSGIARRARKTGSRLPDGFVLSVLAHAAEGLHAAHEACGADGEPLGLVHRDVSPQNIHVGYDGHVKVVDFGIAAARGRRTTTRTGELKGKIAYLAPEQIDRRSPMTRRTDVWALGVVAWELLVGERLFVGDSESTTMWNTLNLGLRDLAELRPDLPKDLTSSVMQCLERNPARRLESCDRLATVFARAAEALPGGKRGDIRAEMEARFATDRTHEELLLREERSGPRELRESPAPREADAPAAVPEEDAPTTPSTPRESAPAVAVAPSKRLPLVAIASVAAVIAAAAGLVWAVLAIAAPDETVSPEAVTTEAISTAPPLDEPPLTPPETPVEPEARASDTPADEASEEGTSEPVIEAPAPPPPTRGRSAREASTARAPDRRPAPSAARRRPVEELWPIE